MTDPSIRYAEHFNEGRRQREMDGSPDAPARRFNVVSCGDLGEGCFAAGARVDRYTSQAVCTNGALNKSARSPADGHTAASSIKATWPDHPHGPGAREDARSRSVDLERAP